jgi:hypothetical protein
MKHPRPTIYRISYTPPEQRVLTVKLICSVYTMPRNTLTQFSKETHTRGSKERRTERDKELRIVRVLRAVVRHRDKPAMRKAQTRVNFILELFCCRSTGQHAG